MVRGVRNSSAATRPTWRVRGMNAAIVHGGADRIGKGEAGRAAKILA